MNVRLSVGTLWNKGQGMRTVGWCMVFLGMMAGTSCTRSAAENTAETRTTLSIATDNVGPRTRVTLTAHVAAPELTASPSGVVNFRAGKADLGSAFLDGEGNASLLTDSLSAGSHQVVAVYTGHAAYLTSTSELQPVQAKVSTVAGFSVAATPTSLSTPVGGFVSTVVTVTPVNGFNSYVSLSCNGLPISTTCTFTPVSVPASCTTSASGVETCVPGSSVMQIQTLAPSPPTTALNPGGSGMGRYAFVFPALLGLAGLGGCRRRRNLALGLLAFAAAMSMTACAQRYKYLNHGPPDNTGTPVGSYLVTVEAQSSTGAETTTPPTNPQLTLTITAAKT